MLKTAANENFSLSIKLDINYELGYIDILVILDNLQNKKRQMKLFHGNEFKSALTQYEQWKTFIF